MLLQQLTQMKALKEGQMKNALMDAIDKACSAADIPDGASYEQAVKAIVKHIQNGNSVASNTPASELADYVKDSFPKEEYVTEDEYQDPSQQGEPAPAPQGEEQPDADAPEEIGKAGDYTVSLDKKSETITLKKGDQTITAMPLVIWSQLKRQ
jgi:hypothetical protein